MISIFTWLLFFALFYLLVTSAVLLRNRIDLTPLPGGTEAVQDKKKPFVSVCIPARNEERNIGTLLESLRLQTYPHFDVHVLDDHSEDQTAKIVQSFQEDFSGRLFFHRGREKPVSWLGKPWACHQLGEKAGGDILLFLDADTETKSGALDGITAAFEQYQTDMITVWPHQKTETFWEKNVIPLIYYALVTLLPAIYVYRDPRWMPSFLKKKFRPLFAAACGQCIAFRKDVYRKINGHESVKNRIVEDVELAKIIRRSGFTMRMFHGIGSVSCRMYSSHKELFEGLRKNFFAGFNHSLAFFFLAMVLHLIVFILPFITIFYSVLAGLPVIFFLSAACIGLVLLHRLILAVWFHRDPLLSFLHPIGVLWFQWLGIVKIIDHFTRRKILWKGRKVS